MIKLASLDLNEEMHRFLSGIASKVIVEALEFWGGNLRDVASLYYRRFETNMYHPGETDFFFGISNYIPVKIVRPEIRAMSERPLYGTITEDAQIGMELIARKIQNMIAMVKDPECYYTFDLFEEMIFGILTDEHQSVLIQEASEKEIEETVSHLIDLVREGAEVPEGEEELFSEWLYSQEDYFDFLAQSVYRLKNMGIKGMEEYPDESLFFWDEDYMIFFKDSFVQGIQRLTSGIGYYLGYKYDSVKKIFTDIGVSAPLSLLGTATAYEMLGQKLSQERFEMGGLFSQELF